MKKIFILLIVFAMVFSLMSACAPQKDEPVRTTDEEPLPAPDDGSTASLMVPQINGTILEIDDDNVQRILVNSRKQVEGQVDGETWVTINEETYFFEDIEEGSSLGISNVSRDFKVGNKVAILVGPIAESDPMQATALSVYENKEQ